MAEPVTKVQSNRLHFDGTITAGNVLTAVTMLIALLAWGFRMEGRIDTERIERQRFESEVSRQIVAGDNRERDSFTEVKAGLRRIEDILINIVRGGPSARVP